MTLAQSIVNRAKLLLCSTFLMLGFLAVEIQAASLQSGLNAPGESQESFRSYGSYLFIGMLGLVAFLLISRGREIRRQHPRTSS